MLNKYLILTVMIHQEEKYFVAVCGELDVSSFGESEQEALDNAVEAIGVYLDTLEDLGERDNYLRQKGVKIHEHCTYATGERIRCPPGTVVHPAVFLLSATAA